MKGGKVMKGRSHLREVCALLFVALFLCPVSFKIPVSGFTSHEVTLVSTATSEGRLAVFDDVWDTVNTRYYDPNFHGLDWDAQRTIFRAQAMKAQSGAELYAVVRNMIASLNDPHTRVFAPEEKSDWWRPRLLTTGCAIAEVDGQPTVVRVERDSAADRQGLQAGDVVDIVDGTDALTIIRERLGNLKKPNGASARSRIFAKLLDGPPETSARVTWITKNGKR